MPTNTGMRLLFATHAPEWRIAELAAWVIREGSGFAVNAIQ
jgi:hypothetical protein